MNTVISTSLFNYIPLLAHLHEAGYSSSITSTTRIMFERVVSYKVLYHHRRIMGTEGNMHQVQV